MAADVRAARLVTLRLFAWALVPCASVVSPAALAAAFQIREDSAIGVGTAFAGSVSSAQTPSTVFDNPAGMIRLPGLQIQLGGSIVGLQTTFHGASANAFGQPNAGFDNRNGGNAALVPQGFITSRISPDLAVGLALTAPFGLSTTYGPGFVGRYQADKSILETININPAVAYQIAPWLSVGAGMSAQYGRADFSNALDSSALAARIVGRPVPLPDGYFRLQGDNWSFGYNLGVLAQPGRQTSVGLTYRSRVQHDFTGTVDIAVPAPLATSPAFRSSPGSTKVVLPDTASLGLTQGFGPNWTGYAEATWTNWSQFKTLNAFRNDGTLVNSTPERFHDSVFVSLGASYRVNDRLTLRGGTAYDSTPVSNVYRTARIPDQSRIWLAAGVSVEVLPQMTVDVGYAHLFVRNSRVRETAVTGDVLTGSFNNAVDIGSVSTRLRF